jgi:23S rRNA pseudouridine2605 synthase
VGDLVPAQFGRLFTVGRLDRDSEGLILLTNDGALAQRLAHPTGAVERTYHVEVRGTVGEGVLGRLRGGIEDAGEFLRPLAVTVAQRSRDGAVLRFVLRTGRKREVRRLCRAAGLAVLVLRRVQFGPLCLGDLQPGQWRELSSAELAALRGAAGSPPRRLAGSRWRWPRNRSVNSVA